MKMEEEVARFFEEKISQDPFITYIDLFEQFLTESKSPFAYKMKNLTHVQKFNFFNNTESKFFIYKDYVFEKIPGLNVSLYQVIYSAVAFLLNCYEPLHYSELMQCIFHNFPNLRPEWKCLSKGTIVGILKSIPFTDEDKKDYLVLVKDYSLIQTPYITCEEKTLLCIVATLMFYKIMHFEKLLSEVMPRMCVDERGYIFRLNASEQLRYLKNHHCFFSVTTDGFVSLAKSFSFPTCNYELSVLENSKLENSSLLDDQRKIAKRMSQRFIGAVAYLLEFSKRSTKAKIASLALHVLEDVRLFLAKMSFSDQRDFMESCFMHFSQVLNQISLFHDQISLYKDISSLRKEEKDALFIVDCLDVYREIHYRKVFEKFVECQRKLPPCKLSDSDGFKYFKDRSRLYSISQDGFVSLNYFYLTNKQTVCSKVPIIKSTNEPEEPSSTTSNSSANKIESTSTVVSIENDENLSNKQPVCSKTPITKSTNELEESSSTTSNSSANEIESTSTIVSIENNDKLSNNQSVSSKTPIIQSTNKPKESCLTTSENGIESNENLKTTLLKQKVEGKYSISSEETTNVSNNQFYKRLKSGLTFLSKYFDLSTKTFFIEVIIFALEDLRVYFNELQSRSQSYIILKYISYCTEESKRLMKSPPYLKTIDLSSIEKLSLFICYVLRESGAMHYEEIQKLVIYVEDKPDFLKTAADLHAFFKKYDNVYTLDAIGYVSIPNLSAILDSKDKSNESPFHVSAHLAKGLSSEATEYKRLCNAIQFLLKCFNILHLSELKTCICYVMKDVEKYLSNFNEGLKTTIFKCVPFTKFDSDFLILQMNDFKSFYITEHERVKLFISCYLGFYGTISFKDLIKEFDEIICFEKLSFISDLSSKDQLEYLRGLNPDILVSENSVVSMPKTFRFPIIKCNEKTIKSRRQRSKSLNTGRFDLYDDDNKNSNSLNAGTDGCSMDLISNAPNKFKHDNFEISRPACKKFLNDIGNKISSSVAYLMKYFKVFLPGALSVTFLVLEDVAKEFSTLSFENQLHTIEGNCLRKFDIKEDYSLSSLRSRPSIDVIHISENTLDTLMLAFILNSLEKVHYRKLFDKFAEVKGCMPENILTDSDKYWYLFQRHNVFFIHQSGYVKLRKLPENITNSSAFQKWKIDREIKEITPLDVKIINKDTVLKIYDSSHKSLMNGVGNVVGLNKEDKVLANGSVCKVDLAKSSLSPTEKKIDFSTKPSVDKIRSGSDKVTEPIDESYERVVSAMVFLLESFGNKAKADAKLVLIPIQCLNDLSKRFFSLHAPKQIDFVNSGLSYFEKHRINAVARDLKKLTDEEKLLLFSAYLLTFNTKIHHEQIFIKFTHKTGIEPTITISGEQLKYFKRKQHIFLVHKASYVKLNPEFVIDMRKNTRENGKIVSETVFLSAGGFISEPPLSRIARVPDSICAKSSLNNSRCSSRDSSASKQSKPLKHTTVGTTVFVDEESKDEIFERVASSLKFFQSLGLKPNSNLMKIVIHVLYDVKRFYLLLSKSEQSDFSHRSYEIAQGIKNSLILSDWDDILYPEEKMLLCFSSTLHQVGKMHYRQVYVKSLELYHGLIAQSDKELFWTFKQRPEIFSVKGDGFVKLQPLPSLPTISLEKKDLVLMEKREICNDRTIDNIEKNSSPKMEDISVLKQEVENKIYPLKDQKVSRVNKQKLDIEEGENKVSSTYILNGTIEKVILLRIQQSVHFLCEHFPVKMTTKLAAQTILLVLPDVQSLFFNIPCGSRCKIFSTLNSAEDTNFKNDLSSSELSNEEKYLLLFTYILLQSEPCHSDKLFASLKELKITLPDIVPESDILSYFQKRRKNFVIDSEGYILLKKLPPSLLFNFVINPVEIADAVSTKETTSCLCPSILCPFLSLSANQFYNFIKNIKRFCCENLLNSEKETSSIPSKTVDNKIKSTDSLALHNEPKQISKVFQSSNSFRIRPKKERRCHQKVTSSDVDDLVASFTTLKIDLGEESNNINKTSTAASAVKKSSEIVKYIEMSESRTDSMPPSTLNALSGNPDLPNTRSRNPDVSNLSSSNPNTDDMVFDRVAPSERIQWKNDEEHNAYLENLIDSYLKAKDVDWNSVSTANSSQLENNKLSVSLPLSSSSENSNNEPEQVPVLLDSGDLVKKALRFFIVILNSDNAVKCKYLAYKLNLATSEVKDFMRIKYPNGILPFFREHSDIFFVSSISKTVYLRSPVFL